MAKEDDEFYADTPERKAIFAALNRLEALRHAVVALGNTMQSTSTAVGGIGHLVQPVLKQLNEEIEGTFHIPRDPDRSAKDLD